MHIVPAVLVASVLAIPSLAQAQSVSIHAAGGPTLADNGYSVVAGIGFSPISRLTISANIEQSHLPSRRRERGNTVSFFRGGTITLATAELRVSLFGRDRVTPYGLVGLGAGRSRPNVNETFPTPVVNDVRAPFAGGGLHVPLGDQLSVFADARLALVVGTEADDLYGLSPLRAGLSWRF